MMLELNDHMSEYIINIGDLRNALTPDDDERLQILAENVLHNRGVKEDGDGGHGYSMKTREALIEAMSPAGMFLEAYVAKALLKAITIRLEEAL